MYVLLFVGWWWWRGRVGRKRRSKTGTVRKRQKIKKGLSWTKKGNRTGARERKIK
jgi:hypothetical protein